MAPVTTPKSPIYAALRQELPAVLKTNLTKNDAPKIHKSIKTLMADTESAQGQVDNKITKIGGSLALNGYAKQAFQGTGGLAYVTFAGKTISEWNSQSTSEDIFRVLILSFVAFIVLGSHLTSLQKKRNARRLQIQNEKKQLIESAKNQESFLRESSRMIKRFTDPASKGKSDKVFSGFQRYIASLPAGVVPNCLADGWAEVGTILSQPDSPQKQEDLDGHLEGTMLPMIHEYAKQIRSELSSQGYAISPEESQDLEELENLDISPLSQGESSQKKEHAAVHPASSSSSKEKEEALDDKGKEKDVNKNLEEVVIEE